MGLLDRFRKKKEPEEKEEEPQPAALGKYDEPCAMCGKLATEKKWMGQYWHKKCVRKGRKMAKGML